MTPANEPNPAAIRAAADTYARVRAAELPREELLLKLGLRPAPDSYVNAWLARSLIAPGFTLTVTVENASTCLDLRALHDAAQAAVTRAGRSFWLQNPHVTDHSMAGRGGTFTITGDLYHLHDPFHGTGRLHRLARLLAEGGECTGENVAIGALKLNALGPHRGIRLALGEIGEQRYDHCLSDELREELRLRIIHYLRRYAQAVVDAGHPTPPQGAPDVLLPFL